MAAVSWSDPNPNVPTAASLGQAARIDPTNIGYIVSSIMRFREEQAAQKQQAFNNMIAGIARGAGEFQQNQQAGAANDAANATMYGIQNPNDPYGGFQNSDVVPDYGGAPALKALESARLMGEFETPEQKALRAAQLDAEQALAHNRWTYPTGSDGTNDLGDFRKQQIINTQDAKDARLALSDELGLTGKELDAAVAQLHRYKPGVSEFPALGEHPSIKDASEGDYKDAALNAVRQYDETMKAIRARVPSNIPGNTGIPGDQHYSPPRLNPNDVAAAAAQLGAENPPQQNPPYGQDIPAEANPPTTVQASPAPAATSTPAPLGYSSPGQLPSPPSSANQEGELSKATQQIAKAIKEAKTEPAGAKPGPTPSAKPTPAPIQIKDAKQYAQLPSGSAYIDPNGIPRVKP